MSPKEIQQLYPKIDENLVTLLKAFRARAASLWVIEDSSPPALLASRSLADGETRTIFRQQATNWQPRSMPRKNTFMAGDDLADIHPLLLKSASANNALALPMRTTSGPQALLVLIDIAEWGNEQRQMSELVADLATQRWQLLLQLQQQQRQLDEMTSQSRQWQGIFMGVQESIVLLDLKGKILSINPATERITGHSAQEIIGHHIGELFPKVGVLGSGPDFPGRSGLYQTLDERRPSDLFEAIVETKDKRHIWINYTYTPLWDGNGNMIGLVRVTSDVSTIKTVEQMKNDFVSIASHELRTPLGVIMSYLNLFLAGQLGPITDDQHMFMERIYHSSADMAALVEDLLNISRIEAGRLEVSVQPFSLNQLIQEVLNHLEVRYQTKNIRIKLDLPDEPIKLQADRQKIEQALTNIIDNAIKYTYEKGTIRISAIVTDATAEIKVKDTGVGISPDHIGHIFEKFYRENNPLSVKEGGSGLGLYISKKLIELHGGTITATSKRGHGSTFSIKLPATEKHIR
jgi:PAS domain S-box-containing protein